MTPTVASIPIGPYDVLNLDVLGEPDLSKDYTVDADGDINVPYVGKIRVGGLTTDQAEQVVTDRLKKFYHNISLNLTRTAIGGISVTITGQVTKTSPVAVKRDAHLNDVIQVLGPTPEADLSKVEITRGLPDQPHTTITADLMSYLNQGTDSGNPLLKDGDVIFVPQKARFLPTTMSVSVVGAVPRPGVFSVNPGTTVYDVVTMAGSLDIDADPKGLYIQPVSNPTAHVLLDWVKLANNPGDPSLNPIVADGDKIVVPQITSVQQFAIMGDVKTPNSYTIHGKISLLDAVAMAGGVGPNADERNVKVTRLNGNGTTATTIKVDLNDSAKAALFQVQPDDTIEVPTGREREKINTIEAIGAIALIVGIFRAF